MGPHHFGNLVPLAEPHPHRIKIRIRIKYKTLDPNPHQSCKLDPEPDPDPHQFADDKSKCIEYEPISIEPFFKGFSLYL
jgi:hypothetical protein